MVKKYGYVVAPTNSFGPASLDNLHRMSRQEQIDPWWGHTKHCSKSRSVLRKAKRVKIFSVIAGAVGAILTSRQRPLSSCLLLCGGIFISRRANKLIVELEGEQHPSNVEDRTFASAG